MYHVSPFDEYVPHTTIDVHIHAGAPSCCFFIFFIDSGARKKKKKKRGVYQPDYLGGLGACLSHRPFQTLRGAPLASCRMRLPRTTTLGTGQSQSFWEELTTRPGCASAARAPSASSGNGTTAPSASIRLSLTTGSLKVRRPPQRTPCECAGAFEHI